MKTGHFCNVGCIPGVRTGSKRQSNGAVRTVRAAFQNLRALPETFELFVIYSLLSSVARLLSLPAALLATLLRQRPRPEPRPPRRVVPVGHARLASLRPRRRPLPLEQGGHLVQQRYGRHGRRRRGHGAPRPRAPRGRRFRAPSPPLAWSTSEPVAGRRYRRAQVAVPPLPRVYPREARVSQGRFDYRKRARSTFSPPSHVCVVGV
jgi:hypothetical protein